MILFVVADSYENYGRGGSFFAIARTLEKLAGDTCVMLHYTQLAPELLARLQPWAVCHSGASADYREYDVMKNRTYRAVVKQLTVPQIGFCGGHQILAHYFGSTVRPIRRLRPDEPDPAPHRPGVFKEWGVYPVRLLRQDPLFAGLGKVIRVQEYHTWEVKRLGRDLVRLAATAACQVQAFRHRLKPIYGTQFHPEQSLEAYPDGIRLLENFFKLARAHRAAGTAP